jgi:(2Fe-2S) ferredoxin
MNKPAHHILVCASFRATGVPQGVCSKKGSLGLLQYLQDALADHGLDDVLVSTTGCLKRCDHGPVMVVYPEGHWYCQVNEEALDEILDALAAGKAAEKYLIP